MIVAFTVTFTVEKTAGPFAGRDEITEAIELELENLDPSLEGLGANGTSDYEVTDTDITRI